jgi:hypothetical protein
MAEKEPRIALTLPLGAVNYVLQTLAARPYGEVKGLMDDITAQTEQALATPALPALPAA